MNMRNMGQFRFCMLSAVILTCGLGLPVVLVIWLWGEYLNIKEVSKNAAK